MATITVTNWYYRHKERANDMACWFKEGVHTADAIHMASLMRVKGLPVEDLGSVRHHYRTIPADSWKVDEDFWGLIWDDIKHDLEADLARDEAISARNRANGKMGGRPRKSPVQTSPPGTVYDPDGDTSDDAVDAVVGYFNKWGCRNVTDADREVIAGLLHSGEASIKDFEKSCLLQIAASKGNKQYYPSVAKFLDQERWRCTTVSEIFAIAKHKKKGTQIQDFVANRQKYEIEDVENQAGETPTTLRFDDDEDL